MSFRSDRNRFSLNKPLDAWPAKYQKIHLEHTYDCLILFRRRTSLAQIHTNKSRRTNNGQSNKTKNKMFNTETDNQNQMFNYTEYLKCMYLIRTTYNE